MKNKYTELTHELCTMAVMRCFKKKWLRHDFMDVINKYAGISRKEFVEGSQGGSMLTKLQVAEAIAFEMENRIDNLLKGDENALDLDEVIIEPRPDGMTGKMRDIATLCVFHQLFNHLGKLGMEKLLSSRILPQQFASIPGRGQTGLADYLNDCVLRGKLNIKYITKTDIKSAYASTQYSIIIGIVEREVPKAKWLITLLKALARMSPTGSLIIGGYLDAWLFNFLMSYVMRYAKSLHTERRGKKMTLVKLVVSFMDDFAFLGTRKASVDTAIKRTGKLLADKYNLVLKVGKSTELLSVEEERRRRKLDSPAKRGCPSIDMGGYRVHRTYTTIRKKIFLRIRRQYLRSAVDMELYGFIRVVHAQKVISYYGFFKHSDSHKAKDNLNANYIFEHAKRAVRHHLREANNAKNSTNSTHARNGNCRATA